MSAEKWTMAKMKALTTIALERRWRISQQFNYINRAPDADEIEAAMWDTLDEINSFPPQTQFSMEDIFSQKDTRWKNLMYLGTARRMYQMLTAHWVAEGLDANIGDISIPNRMSDFDALASKLEEQFNSLIERLKETSQKFIRGVSGSNRPSLLMRFGRVVSWRRIFR